MLDLAICENRIPAMSSADIDKVKRLEMVTSTAPQTAIATSHIIHAGMYARTITIPAGVILTGALIKVATLLIVEGEVIVFVGGEPKLLTGYNVLAASGNRKQAFVAKTATNLTMIFSTKSQTVSEAEQEFTDEAELLFSRDVGAVNNVLITGE